MKKFLNEFTRKMYIFMQGRYGMDKLNQDLTYFILLVLVLNIFLKSSILSLMGTILWLAVIYRCLSKKFYPRSRENEKYLQILQPYQPFFKLIKMQSKDKANKYFICKNCHQVVRVPKGRGKITITCPRCKYQFDKKS